MPGDRPKDYLLFDMAPSTMLGEKISLTFPRPHEGEAGPFRRPDHPPVGLRCLVRLLGETMDPFKPNSWYPFFARPDGYSTLCQTFQNTFGWNLQQVYPTQAASPEFTRQSRFFKDTLLAVHSFIIEGQVSPTAVTPFMDDALTGMLDRLIELELIARKRDVDYYTAEVLKNPNRQTAYAVALTRPKKQKNHGPSSSLGR